MQQPKGGLILTNSIEHYWAPSQVNDSARTVQADIRSWYVDAEWADHGDSGISRASASTFKITSDVTSRYTVNRRIKCYDASTLYGVITASSYSAPDTTVTVGLDSGSLSSSLTSVALAILSPSNISVPTTTGRKGADIASATTTDLTTATGDFVDITGTTTITAFGTIASGVERTVRFTGALTLTHNATSLILPGSANITTANGDTAIFRSLGSGNWKCIAYTKQDGTPIIAATVAAQSDMETGTSTTLMVTPGRQHFHQSAAKFWTKIVVTAGTPASTESYNVSSITDGGVGIYTANFTTSLSTSTYPVVSMSNLTGGVLYGVGRATQSGSGFGVNVANTSTHALADEIAMIAGYGDI